MVNEERYFFNYQLMLGNERLIFQSLVLILETDRQSSLFGIGGLYFRLIRNKIKRSQRESNDISLKIMLSIGKVEACTSAAWDYTLKVDVSNSDFLDCITRIWDGGTGMWDGGAGVRDGGSGTGTAEPEFGTAGPEWGRRSRNLGRRVRNGGGEARVRNGEARIWGGEVRVRDGEARIWDGEAGVWGGEARVWGGEAGMRSVEARVWYGETGVKGGEAEVWDSSTKAWAFNTIFGVNRKFLSNANTIFKNNNYKLGGHNVNHSKGDYPLVIVNKLELSKCPGYQGYPG